MANRRSVGGRDWPIEADSLFWLLTWIIDSCLRRIYKTPILTSSESWKESVAGPVMVASEGHYGPPDRKQEADVRPNRRKKGKSTL